MFPVQPFVTVVSRRLAVKNGSWHNASLLAVALFCLGRSASFSKCPVPRMHDLPAIDTILLNRKDLTSAGAGETPIIAVAPAIANAVFDATGVRLRSMPLQTAELEGVA